MKKIIVVLLMLCASTAVFAQQKYALVIGNANYTNKPWGKLDNPVNDANDMKTALELLGFQVEIIRNGNLDQMQLAVINFKQKLKASPSSYGFFYYAGHGAQDRNSQNYLIPYDAETPSLNLLPQRALPVQFIMDELDEAKNDLIMIVLDACREIPASLERSGSRGLSVISSPPRGSIVMYATGANKTASDGGGKNGLFTSQLLNHLKTPGLSIYEVFDKTMGDVSRMTGGEQHPELRIMVSGANTTYLGSRPVQPAPASSQSTAVQPASQPAPTSAASTQRPIPDSFVRIEGGTFQMGSNNGDKDEKPVHAVTVKSFNMSKYQITQKEWREVMGTSPSKFKGDNLPVEQVSWYDAVEFCNKLSVKEGLTPAFRGSGNSITCDWSADGYRLPTEAEWEYAARGGNKDYLQYEYSGGNNADVVAWYSSNSGKSTHPVGQKAANSLGLYDMTGNVYEWCWDWFDKSYYSVSPSSNPLGPASGVNRVVRGGSWGDSARYVRSANRIDYTPSNRYSVIGFRLVRP